MYGNNQGGHRGGRYNNAGRGGSSRRINDDKKTVTCSQGGMSVHSKEKCVELVGFPPGFKSRDKAQSKP